MSVFQHIPAMLRMTMVFVLILFIIRKRISLGNAFFLGALFLSLLFGLEPGAMFGSMVASIVYPKTLALTVIVTLILILSNSMETTGQMQRLLGKFQGLLSSPRLNLFVFPALIGLLPMPGGAILSAPMVKELGIRSRLSGQQLSYINYWFRHIWEYWWPIYPGVLLATLMADINLMIFVVFMSPLTVIAVFFGWLPLKNLDQLEKKKNNDERPPAWPFIKELVPILIVIIPGLCMGTAISLVFPSSAVAKETGLILSLFMAIGWIWYDNHLPWNQALKILKDPQLIKMGYMVMAILIFKGILGDSHAVEAISNELTLLHVPIVLITIILPFIVGLFTGITIAFVGSTFPILITLIHSAGETPFMQAYVMLALVCGFSGVLLSPLHLCLLLSNEYFETTLKPVYRYLWLPCTGLLFSSIAYFWILRGLCRWI
jgi:integral membrane protein (TIGR00529 family)